MIKDFSIFVKITAKGAISVLILMLFIIYVGITSLLNTNYKLTLFQEVSFDQRTEIEK